jgi:hypothetical protein
VCARLPGSVNVFQIDETGSRAPTLFPTQVPLDIPVLSPSMAGSFVRVTIDVSLLSLKM